MAKTNYTFEKRQKEIAKKQKKEAKLLKKTVPHDEQAQEDTAPVDQSQSTSDETTNA